MDIPEISSEIKQQKVSLKRLYLDPNNYRFIDNEKWVEVGNDKITDVNVQKRTRGFIAGKNNVEIDDLLRSFKKNGYLPVDQIQVQRLEKGDGDGYVVKEGNRRIAALKELEDEYIRGNNIGIFNPELFEKVPVVISSGVDENHFKILMGLKHISGNKKWPAVNQATMLKSLRDTGMSEADIKDALGITTVALRRYLRTLSLVDAYRAGDYGDQFRNEMFNIFSETIKLPPLMAWLGWNDTLYKCTNETNQQRFFSWMSREDADESDTNATLDPIITKGTDLRDLAKILNKPNALEQMENDRSLTNIYLQREEQSSDRLNDALNILEKGINTTFASLNYATAQQQEKLLGMRKNFDRLLSDQQNTFIEAKINGQKRILVPVKNTHFSTLTINYKSFNSLRIEKLNKINLFAGGNNSGKSSLLEAIFILINQNDLSSIVEIQRRRGKFSNKMPTSWFATVFPEHLEISGTFDQRDTKITIDKNYEQDEFEKSDYVTSFEVNAMFAGTDTHTQMRVFNTKQNELNYEQLVNICPIIYTSPFSTHSQEQLLYAHEISKKSQIYDQIIGFVRDNIDKKLKNIDLITSSENGGMTRFIVTHDDFDAPIDLVQFGDGLQRIFHIALQMAAAKNGILLIDEIENAIHHKWFAPFIRFMQLLGEQFNVQLFITSHSKEFIDAFFEEKPINLDSISTYRLFKKEDKTYCKYASGQDFASFLDTLNTDLRG